MQRFFSYPAHKNPGQTDGRTDGQTDRIRNLFFGLTHIPRNDRLRLLSQLAPQMRGCAMGSTVSPSLAIFFMDQLERRLLATPNDLDARQ